jgi:hypothetical protein
VANLLALPSQTGMALLRRVAEKADVQRYLRNPSDDTRDAARARLATLAIAGDRETG